MRPFTRNVFARQSRARHTRLSSEASGRHDRRRANTHAGQSRIHRCAARSAKGTRGVCGRRGRVAEPRKRLSRMSSHPPPTAHRRLTPLHPPTSAGVVPLARRRRRHHDACPRTVRPRRSVSPLSTCARASGLPKQRTRFSSQRSFGFRVVSSRSVAPRRRPRALTFQHTPPPRRENTRGTHHTTCRQSPHPPHKTPAFWTTSLSRPRPRASASATRTRRRRLTTLSPPSPERCRCGRRTSPAAARARPRRPGARPRGACATSS